MPRDDDEDRPRKRRPRDDEEDDRPRSRRKPRDDDEDDDRPRSRRRVRDEDDYDDRPRKRKKKKAEPRAKEMSVLGLVGLIIGVLALVISIFMPCIASYSFIVSGTGIVIGFIALAMAQKSDGRQGAGMPIAGLSISALAVVIAVAWLMLGKKIEKDFDKEMKEFEVQAAKEEAAHKAEVAKAAGEVQAGAESAIRVTAVQFYQAYDNDDEQADRVYKNKIIEVTGVMGEVNFKGEVYMVLLKGGRDEDETVDCNFAKSPEVRARLAQLMPGQTVRIRGKCLGGDCILEACVLVE